MLTFSEWNQDQYGLSESLSDNVKNWLSRTFGGKISQIDYLISEFVSAENEYIKEWNKIQLETDAVNREISSGKIPEEEVESYRNRIELRRGEIEALERRKTQKIRDLNIKILDLIKGDPRATKYWNLKKSEAEVEVARKMYDLSKKFSDKRIENSLYSNYLKTYDSYRDKEREVEDIVPDEAEKEVKSPQFSTLKDIGKFIGMNPREFSSEVRRYSSEDRRKIKKFLIDQKNLRLNDLRSLRRNKSLEINKAGRNESGEILQIYNEKIYSLGETIDRLREKIIIMDEQSYN